MKDGQCLPWIDFYYLCVLVSLQNLKREMTDRIDGQIRDMFAQFQADLALTLTSGGDDTDGMRRLKDNDK